MTQVVVDAERRGELPPKGISPTDIDGPEQPTLAELKAAFNLHRLSYALAEAFCQRDIPYPTGQYHLQCGETSELLDTYDIDVGMSGETHRMPPEPPNRVDEWLARASQTVFRVLVVGAALAGTYWEPALAARVHPDPEIRALVSGEKNRLGELGPEARDFLLSFAACDLEAPLETQDALFAPLAEWLLADILGDREGRQAMAARFENGVGRAAFCKRADFCKNQYYDWPCPPDIVAGDNGSSHSDAHLVVWELMKMLWVVEQLRYWDSCLVPAAVSRADPGETIESEQSTSRPSSSATRSEPRPPLAVAVFFGHWRAENVELPTCPGFTGDWETLLAHPVVSDPAKERPVQWLLETAFLGSGRPNHFEETCPAPPLELKFFEYCLRRHVNLCFLEKAFHRDRVDFLDLECQAFVDCITIFCHDDVEGRQPGLMLNSDFIDGAAMLRTWPSQTPRFYQSYREEQL